MNQMPERIQMLSLEVRETSGFEAWIPDGSEQSVLGLGLWLKDQAKARELTEEDRQQIGIIDDNPLNEWIARTHIEMSAKTYSYSIDSGMYFGEIIRTRHPATAWRIGSKPKRGVNYNRPVVATEDDYFIIDPVGWIANSLHGYLLYRHGVPGYASARNFDLLRDLHERERHIQR
ncbi:MAG: hypothetical protein KF757_12875 [Phycisphaeraceae bacterium]|nr:hypothetical protein [Phycisphaeraceae bacterium]